MPNWKNYQRAKTTRRLKDKAETTWVNPTSLKPKFEGIYINQLGILEGNLRNQNFTRIPANCNVKWKRKLLAAIRYLSKQDGIYETNHKTKGICFTISGKLDPNVKVYE